MTLKRFRQTLKALGDDTRLRLLNLILKKELTVKDMCNSLQIVQPTVSKHLMRLRLLRIVIDRRDGNMVYYRLNRNSEHGQVAFSIIAKAKRLDTFIGDLRRMKKCVK